MGRFMQYRSRLCHVTVRISNGGRSVTDQPTGAADFPAARSLGLLGAVNARDLGGYRAAGGWCSGPASRCAVTA